jgi:hypothetical protein
MVLIKHAWSTAASIYLLLDILGFVLPLPHQQLSFQFKLLSWNLEIVQGTEEIRDQKQNKNKTPSSLTFPNP